MSSNLIKELKNDFPILIEAGFVAVNFKDEDSANKLFKAAAILNPESSAPDLGFGYIALNKLELDEAQKHFKDVLKKEPEHELAKTFMGISLVFDPKTRTAGKEMISEILKVTEDEHVKNLCTVSLEWIKKDFKDEGGSLFEPS